MAMKSGEKSKLLLLISPLKTGYALSSHNATYSHSRHIHIDELVNLGLKIVPLEELDNRSIDDCKDLQDCVLTIHHSFMQTLASTNALKIVENHAGQAMIITASQQA